MRRIRRTWLAAGLLALRAGVPLAAEPAAAGSRLEAQLARALERTLPAEGIAIGVVLRGDDLPAPGPGRSAAIQARQQRVLAALPAARFRLKHRYSQLSGFSGWAQRDAIEALLGHAETAHVYLDGRVRATLAQGAALVGAGAVHAQGYTGAGVRVAVLDSGIDSDHPHLADDVAAQQCFCDDHPSPAVGCCPNGQQTQANAEDDNGHGTYVAGVITSSRSAGPGVAPDAEIVAVKVLDADGNGSFSDIAAGLDWVLTNRVTLAIRVVNLSLGDGVEHASASAFPCAGTNTANAIQALAAAGVSVFASSGNEGFDAGIGFPACVAGAISVGGVYDASLGSVSWCGNASCSTILCTDSPTFADRFVCHTNSGPLLDLLAPDWRTDTTALGGGTASFGGTSAACPYAAAQAALLLQANAALTPAQVLGALQGHGAAVSNPDNGLSFTRSDVAAALPSVLPAVCGNGSVESGEDCDDGNTAGGDCCSAACGFESAGSACEDGSACSLGDVCDGAGACGAGAPLVCDDGAFCNGAETCDPGSGCVAGPAPVLDDEVDCTRDRCDEALDQVVHNPRDFECVDADECTVDRCDAVQGCVHEPNPACLQAPTSLPSGGHGARALLFLALALLGTVSLRAGSIDSARLWLAARALRALAMRAGGRSRRSSSGRGRRRRRSRD